MMEEVLFLGIIMDFAGKRYIVLQWNILLRPIPLSPPSEMVSFTIWELFYRMLVLRLSFPPFAAACQLRENSWMLIES